MLYKQKTGPESFRIVIMLKWTDEEVMLQDIKTGLVYVMLWENFFDRHEELTYDCDLNTYSGIDLDKIKGD